MLLQVATTGGRGRGRARARRTDTALLTFRHSAAAAPSVSLFPIVPAHYHSGPPPLEYSEDRISTLHFMDFGAIFPAIPNVWHEKQVVHPCFSPRKFYAAVADGRTRVGQSDSRTTDGPLFGAQMRFDIFHSGRRPQRRTR